MDYALKFQKLCQFEARRLLLVVGIIASVLLLQSFTIPYGNVFLFLYPSDVKVLVPEKSISLNGDGDFSPRPEMVGRLPPLNDSTLTDLSSVPEMGTDAEAEMGKRTKSDNIRKEQKEDSKFELETENDGGLDNAFELDDDRESDKESTGLDDKSTRSQNNKTQYNISAIINNVEPEHSSPKDEVPESDGKYSLDTLWKENNDSNSEKVPSGNTSFISPVTPAPIVMTNLTSPISDSSTSITLVSSNTSSVVNQAAAPSPKDVLGSPVTPTGNPTMNKNAATEHYNEEISPPSVTSVSEMNRILVQSRTSSHSMKPRWSSVRDQEILSAKLQIENAPIITSDPELYAPIFRNISMFKKSYELMERVLKVYIYKEGSRPIFHQPVLKGIYASEGWFMRSMEGNKQFVVKDPTKAHLFYLPFSTRMLQTNMYVPDSHSHKNLIAFLKNYLDVIVAKYPYWNRTEGADHFLAACHDWAPAETRQYMSNCIRALCNSDINVGFTIGKDVSLPETLISNQKDPLKYLGGEPPRKRPTLAFFAGGMHGYLRPILLQYWENKDPDMKIFGKLGRGKKNKMNYINYMRSSKYCICAKGFEVNSPRVVESIYYECVPVIISDNFVPPFFEILDWEKFAVFVPEKDIPKLKEVLLSIPEKRYLEMQMRVKKVQQHFLWHSNPVKYDIFHMILHSIWYNRVFQIRAKDS